ncbi:4-hydroxy-tetrahydrodipicolinate synthase [Streptomyces calidiresistens]|uniref:4-hydroxy-tetrahydrodipicolinate synthase n=1 Tax=Streptomyces calidiresistens TaxID=1485586 RepID=A0A7W3T252_9ACTN|nr:dihydrodipicolinate synthase family protein [Streptomyces calidiresistens]MBB0229532.1 4-hydroxy-tetrahydrodipicolinate synthase [Streptomyces calidiresistens]
MTRHLPPTGLHVPLVTPFDTEGRLDAAALEGLGRELLEAGARGLVALGTTGEPTSLDPAERATVLDVCARVGREHDALLTVGVGGGDTRTVERALADLADRPGVGAALVPVPAFVRPSPAGVLAHFARLARATPVPLIVYHVPRRTGCSPGAECLRAVLDLPGVVGMKLSPDVIDGETVRLMGTRPSDRSILVGDDHLLQPLVAMGAVGGITASAHLATGRFAEFLAAAADGVDHARTRVLGHALAELSAALFREPNPTVIKGVLRARGRIPTADVRLPLLPASRDAVATAGRLLTAVEHRGVPARAITTGGSRPVTALIPPGGDR